MATLTLTATEYPATSPPGVRLDITASGTPTVTSVTVTRTDAGGRAFPVRTADGSVLPVSGGTATVWDYEIPYGTTVTYAAAATGATTVTDVASLDVPEAWLVHVGVPALSQPFVAASVPNLSRGIERGIYQVIGRRDPIVVTGGARSLPSGELGLLTKTDAERLAMSELLDDGSILFLNVPVSKSWGFESCYVAVGEVSEARIARLPSDLWRVWTLPFQVVGRPAGGSQALVTWQTIYDSYGAPTWAELYAAAGNPTWAELANPIT